MPSVTKQTVSRPPTTPVRTPTPISRSSGPTAGLLGRATAVQALRRAPMRVLVYGQNRVGKTTLAAQFPKPLVLVSFEPSRSGGAESVRAVDGVHYLRVVRGAEPAQPEPNTVYDGLRGAVRLAQELAADTYFRTVVVDGATSAQDLILCELLDLPAVPNQMSWGMVSSDQYRARSEKVRELLRPFLDLPQDVVILAKEKDHNPPRDDKVNERTGKAQPDMRPRFLRGVQNESFISCDLGGATAGWLQDSCDCVCRLFVEEEVEERRTEIDGLGEVINSVATGRYVRYLRVGYHPNYAAGIRSSRPDQVAEVLKGPRPEDLYANLMDALGVPAEGR